MIQYNKATYFEYIPASPRKDMILTRLGYKNNTTELSKRDIRMIDEAIRLGNLLCRPSGAYIRLKIDKRNSCLVKFENAVELQSRSLSNMLRNSGEVVLMAGTAGNEVVRVISNEVKNGDAAMGLMLDSVASQTADAVLEWIMEFLNNMLAKEGRMLTKHRYSPGFGDLQLSCQKPVFETLKLERLGMELTEKFMLIPEKSVIAIAGIEERGI